MHLLEDSSLLKSVVVLKYRKCEFPRLFVNIRMMNTCTSFSIIVGLIVCSYS